MIWTLREAKTILILKTCLINLMMIKKIKRFLQNRLFKLKNQKWLKLRRKTRMKKLQLHLQVKVVCLTSEKTLIEIYKMIGIQLKSIKLLQSLKQNLLKSKRNESNQYEMTIGTNPNKKQTSLFQKSLQSKLNQSQSLKNTFQTQTNHSLICFKKPFIFAICEISKEEVWMKLQN